MDEQQISQVKNEMAGLSVRDIFFKYLRFLPLIILCVAVALFGAYIYLRYATRIYNSGGRMIIEQQKQSSQSDRAEDILFGSNRAQNLQNEIEVLKSVPLMTRVVKNLGLSLNYTAKGRIIESNIYNQAAFSVDVLEIADSSSSFALNIKITGNDQFQVNKENTFRFGEIFKNQHGVFRLQKKISPEVGTEVIVSWQPAEQSARQLVGSLSVVPAIPGTGILAVSMRSTNPYLARDVVNTLMSEYDSMTIEQNNFSTDQMIGFINSRLAILNEELDSAQQKLLEYQEKQNLIDVDIQSSAYFGKITETDKAIDVMEAQFRDAGLVESYLTDKRNRYQKVTVPSSLGLSDKTLVDMVAIYNAAQLERQRLIDGNVPLANPLIKEEEGKIEKVRESVLENVRNLKSAYQLNLSALRNQHTSNQSDVNSLPYKIKEYVELRRQVEVKLELVKTLQGKREEAAISRASTISNSKIIDRAGASTTPIKPDRNMVRLLAVLIGLSIPLLVIFVLEILNDKVGTRNDIERITQTPILGEVGHSFKDGTLVVTKTNRSMVAEQFRIIRSNLQYILNKIEKPVIMITSSFSGEGKSFVSTNMGAVLSITGKKTIILEFDIRKPKVLSGLNMSKKPGISNFLVGKAELSELIIKVPDTDQLYVLPCGPIPPNPSELLLDPRVETLFTDLKKQFDVIIIDTAPVGMVSDAMTLGKFADCTLYLVRQGHTHKKQIGMIEEFYKTNKLPRISIIVNDVKVKPGYGYYGSGRYGYGYGYSADNSYYEEESVPKTFFEKLIGIFNIRNWFKGRKK